MAKTKTLFNVHFRFSDTGQNSIYAVEAYSPAEAHAAAKAFYAPRLLIVGKIKVSKAPK